ncbi:hypothetical protein ACLESO_55240, partial [Pyxidicoccus sp. 3LG]
GLGMLAPHSQVDDLRRIWRVLGETLVPQVLGWKVPALRATVLLFASAPSRGLHGETLGWERHVERERLAVVPLGSSHFGTLQSPSVETLAARMLAWLDGKKG